MRIVGREACRFLLLSTVSMTACSSGPMIVTDHLTSATLQRAPLQGLTYFLPKAVLMISLTGADGSDAGAKNNPGTAATPTATPATPAPSGGSAKNPSTAPFATATASPQVTVNVQTGQGNDKAGSGAMKAGGAYKLAVTVGKPLIVPDPSAEYYLRYTPSGWSDDTLSLHVDANGLMQSAKGQSVDQSPAVGTALVQLAAIAAGFPGSIAAGAPSAAGRVLGERLPGGGGGPRPPARKCALPSINKTFSFEPGYAGSQDDGVEDSTISRKASDDWETPVTFTWRVISNAQPPSAEADQYVDLVLTETLKPRYAGASMPDSAAIPIKGVNFNDAATPLGILFRDWANWTLKVEVIPSSEAQRLCHLAPMKHEIHDLLMPNRGNLFWENMNRQSLIDKQISLTVQNGMLTGVDPTRPSTVLARIKLPLTIIQPIIAAPFAAIAATKPTSSGSTSTSGN